MASRLGQADISRPQETTPLLPREDGDVREGKRGNSVLFRILLCGLIVSISFGVTQVPMLFVFRQMTCDAYYEHHGVPSSPTDRCAKRPIEARMAREVTILAASTTIFGLMNLLVTGWSIKRFGVKRALLIQVFWPAVRLAVQNVGVMAGSNAGILIMQGSQIITIIGGPSGYILSLNSFITDVVAHEHRTSSLGRLAGSMQVGSAVGFLVGGLVGEALSILAPFRMTLALFLLCFVYIALALPSIPHQQETMTPSEKPKGMIRFFGPLRIFAPQRWTLPNGRSSRQYGALALGVGVFLGILATGYIVMLLQMYSIDEFGFSTSANGWLIFMYSSLRGAFLTFVFPRIISRGRKWLQPSPREPSTQEVEHGREAGPQHASISPGEIEVTDPMDNETEPLIAPERNNKQETYDFDLLYARCSLLADGLLTGLAVFVSEGWQMYILAFLLPLAAGTGSASKGTILQMIPSDERVDALAGITLVENIARLSTTAVFGAVFAALAELGKIHLVFLCNAGIALLGFSVLCLSCFPPKGSKRT
ncbi:MFS general substrate transporter [Lentithecium fluviatile CBS 122367]|uniref:MFS general substrate transporter n=1 Tax=Lentithecium fluviatile CBS 122367 TaxID=1168545 RepID=A0A6G1IRM5_9PLEO|nr:MFS general substrate transporter [Lentithecium fluviatile CBS 122367]